jgi:hypothetical protein
MKRIGSKIKGEGKDPIFDTLIDFELKMETSSIY